MNISLIEIQKMAAHQDYRKRNIYWIATNVVTRSLQLDITRAF